ncbi:MAG: LacI family transcriptional regulator [Actinomycetota bacterium]|nr:LacI family transcriptional regulator [Actinomycetota bacterium]
MAATSVRDVAQHAGVSVGTVSNVLNHPEKVLPATVTRVQNSIDQLGFIRNDAARQLRAGRSTTIGLILLQASNPFFTEVARGVEEGASELGFSTLLGNSAQNHRRELAYLELFEQQRVHGVLISPVGDVTARLEGLKRTGIAAVLVDRSGAGSHSSSVSVDDVAGGQLAVEHLIDNGRRRIAFLGGRFEFRQVTDRLEGARRAVAAHPGVTLEVIEVDTLDVLAGRSAGDRVRARVADARPDGIFAANDLLAVGVLQSLVMLGEVRVPQDIALIGYDDIDFASTAVVPLSSIRQPSERIGATALEILLEEAEDPTLAPRQVVFQPNLVARTSTIG